MMKRGSGTIIFGRISAGAILGAFLLLVFLLALTARLSTAAENEATVVFGVT